MLVKTYLNSNSEFSINYYTEEREEGALCRKDDILKMRKFMDMTALIRENDGMCNASKNISPSPMVKKATSKDAHNASSTFQLRAQLFLAFRSLAEKN